jgi:hypothetical protein
MLWLLKTRHGKALLSCLKSFSCIPGILQSPGSSPGLGKSQGGGEKEESIQENEAIHITSCEERRTMEETTLTVEGRSGQGLNQEQTQSLDEICTQIEEKRAARGKPSDLAGLLMGSCWPRWQA